MSEYRNESLLERIARLKRERLWKSIGAGLLAGFEELLEIALRAGFLWMLWRWLRVDNPALPELTYKSWYIIAWMSDFFVPKPLRENRR